MNIQEFTKKLRKNTNLKTTLEIRTYIPISEKRAILEDVLDRCYTVEDGVLACDQTLKTIAFRLAMIKYHTNLDLDIESYEDYDSIAQLEIDICDEFVDDYGACFTLFNSMEKELHSQYSVEASVARLSNRISNSVDDLVSLMANKMQDLDMNKWGFEGSEIDKFKEMLNKYGK